MLLHQARDACQVELEPVLACQRLEGGGVGRAAGAEQLGGAFEVALEPAGRVAGRRRALIAVALDFWTWRRLDREGLDDAAAAAIMAQAVARAPSAH